jgi:flagellar biosynthetic protein FliP
MMKNTLSTKKLHLAAVLGLGFALVGAVLFGLPVESLAQAPPTSGPGGVHINIGDGDVPSVMKLTVMLTLMALLPAMLMTMTSFTRIIIVFSFLRLAMGTQQTPPNQVLIGLSLFLSLFVMGPTLTEVEKNAYTPYVEGRLDTTQAMDAGSVPLRSFMLKQTREKDLALFFQVSGRAKPATVEEVPMTIVIPAFIISELKTAFEIGFLIYIPFLVIDMLVASILMSMGMMMLPPVVISLPFKLLLFVMIDGWYLIVGTLIQSFG